LYKGCSMANWISNPMQFAPVRPEHRAVRRENQEGNPLRVAESWGKRASKSHECRSNINKKLR
jgi:hypothetical protein